MVVSAVGPGSSLDGGKYRIVRLIAEGGMGAVYEAEHTVMHKRVAIKWLHPGLSLHARGADRMVQEARAAARVRHPHVVDVYDVGREGDAVYLVMEYLEGEPLSALLARGGLPMHRFIALLLPALRGVAAAHRQGVIHRDLKPDNIYLTRPEEGGALHAKVLDFGISKLESRGGEPLSLTRSGGTVGTPAYMSYEQLRGSRTIDGRTDVYALGVILYEALTGRLPHDADSYPELVVKVTTSSAVPARQRNADIPPPLERIIGWALAREPQDRIASVEALVAELEPFATETGFRADMETTGLPSIPASMVRVETSPTPLPYGSTVFATQLRGSEPDTSVGRTRRPRTRLWALGAAVLLLALGSLYALTDRTRSASTPPVQPTASAQQAQPSTSQVLSSSAPSVVITERAAPTTPVADSPPREAEARVAPLPERPSTRPKRPARVVVAPARVDGAPRVVAPTAEPPPQEPVQVPKLRVPVPVAADFY